MSERTDHAVVLGGSMAGLLAARALSERYAKVTILDRDDLTLAGASARRGVPQGRHVHVLLPRGQQVLEDLFPGITGHLISAGAPFFDPLGEARLQVSGHWLRRAPSGLRMATMSRPFLESHVRARVADLPNVAVAPPCDIRGLDAPAGAARVTGVRLSRRGESGTEVLDADLVVDATGRGSRASQWLEQLGYGTPNEESVAIRVGYATAVYRLPPDPLDGDWGRLQGPTPELPRGAAFWRLEDDQWMLTLFGVLGDYPPTDPDGFAAFARSLHNPELIDAIAGAEPIEKPVPHRFPANLRRRYERLPRFPDGFVLLGDSVCSFNPIYGQGMTVAALEALALRRHLQQRAVPQPRRFLRDVARVIQAPWEMAIGPDLAFPAAQGRRTRKLQAANAYTMRLHAAAAHDATLATAFLRVAGMVDRPESLMRPGMAARVLRHALPRRSRSRARTARA